VSRRAALRRAALRRAALRHAGALGVLLAGLLPVGGTAFAASDSLSATFVGNATFPHRTLAVWGSPLAPTQLTVKENGGSVADLRTTRISQARAGDFGTIAVIDESSKLTGAQRAAELAAVRALTAGRTGHQQLGLITFGSSTAEPLALSDQSPTIGRALVGVQSEGSAQNVLPALSLAIQRLKSSVAAGAVVVIAPGSTDQLSGSLTPSAVADAARAAGIRVFTIGVQGSGRSSKNALAHLRATAGGTFVQAPASGLAGDVNAIWSTLIRGYVVRYRSLAPHGRSVAVTVSVAGVPGTATASYASPSLPKPPPAPAKPVVHKAPAPKGFPVPGARLNPLPPVPLAAASPAATGSFLGSPVLAALLAAGLIGLALSLLIAPFARRSVQSRVETFISDGPGGDGDPLEDAGTGRGRLAGLLARQPWWPEFVEQIDIGRVEHSPEQLVRVAIGISLVAAVLGTLVFGTALVALPLLAVGPVAVRTGVRRAVKRQRTTFAEQLPAHLQDLAGAMRSGRSLVGALSAVVETADEPFKGELADERLGLPLEQTLTTMGTRMQSEDMAQVALIATLNRRSGSNAAETLDQVADGARERADMRRELTAMTGQARISSWVLTALPPVLLLAIVAIDSQYARPLFHSVPGAIVLIIAGMMVVAGWFVMKKIIDVEV
jgi:tight adherence protein B